MSLNTWHRQGPRKPSSCATFTLNSHWGRVATSTHTHTHKILCHAHRVPSVQLDSLRPCRLWAARLLCQGGGLQAGTRAHTGQHWLPCPSRALCFLLPQPPTPLSTWCCQDPCDPSSCTTSTPALTGADPSPPGQSQELSLSRRPTCRGGNKTTIETRGQCG